MNVMYTLTDRYVRLKFTLTLLFVRVDVCTCVMYKLTDGQLPLKHTLGVNVEGQTLERPRDLEVEIFPIERAETHVQHMRKCNAAQHRASAH